MENRAKITTLFRVAGLFLAVVVFCGCAKRETLHELCVQNQEGRLEDRVFMDKAEDFFSSHPKAINPDEEVINLLFLAVTSGNARLAGMMLDRGITPDSTIGDTKMPLLVTGAFSGQYDIVRLFLERGAEVNVGDEEHGLTPLMAAVVKNRSDIVRLLLEHGADPNMRTKTHVSPLIAAEANRYEACERILLSYGAQR
jgi:ankyrin repeat protein